MPPSAVGSDPSHRAVAADHSLVAAKAPAVGGVAAVKKGDVFAAAVPEMDDRSPGTRLDVGADVGSSGDAARSVDRDETKTRAGQDLELVIGVVDREHDRAVDRIRAQRLEHLALLMSVLTGARHEHVEPVIAGRQLHALGELGKERGRSSSARRVRWCRYGHGSGRVRAGWVDTPARRWPGEPSLRSWPRSHPPG